MAKFKLEIECDNAAFFQEDIDTQESVHQPGLELSRILKDLSLRVTEIDPTGDSFNIRDVNGNTVGKAKLVA